MTDPIADMFTRIRNAYLAGQDQVQVPHSGLKLRLAQKLRQLGYLTSVDQNTYQNHPGIIITLNYPGKRPAITHLRRISKPGRRIYLRANRITPTLSGHGSSLISTSRGILTDQEAKKLKVGGEIICQIW